MNTKLLQTGLAKLLMGLATTSNAATFDIVSAPEYDNVIVLMNGEISEGDAQRFSDIVATLGATHATIAIQGPGGLVGEALDIGAQIRIAHFATMVASQTECYSACALIWLAGERRYLAQDSIIGVHAAYRSEPGDQRTESGVANASIGAFLNMIGLPLDAITYVTTAPPDQIQPITPAIARSLGIEVYEQNGSATITPSIAPTAHGIARQFTETIGVSIYCSELLQLDQDEVRAVGEALLRKSHAMFGGARMAEIISWMPSDLRSKAEQQGYPAWCFETVPLLRAEGVQFGFDGPSFDCTRAATPTERVICEEPSLWVRDRAMAALYSSLRENYGPALRAQLRDTQHAWILWRDSCAWDKDCVLEAYRVRLKDFGVE